jgi:hypothetical protein
MRISISVRDVRSFEYVRVYLALFAAVALFASGCGGASNSSTPSGGDPPITMDGYAVTLRAGATDVGSGRPGLALLATVRDPAGSGPLGDWPGSLYATAGYVAMGDATYSASGPGSYMAWTWPGALLEGATDFELYFGPDLPSREPVPFTASPATSLGIPAPHLSADGQTVEWAAASGAVTYRCIVKPIGSMPVTTIGTATSCSLAGVAAGAYLIQVQALSIDLAALGSNTSPVPSLPARFDVSEGRLGVFVPTGGGTRLQFKAAGGEVRLGMTPYLAIWASIRTPDGTPTGSTWSLAYYPYGAGVVSATEWSPYPAGAAQALTLGLSYAYPATPGDYLLEADNGVSQIYTLFTVGAPAQLSEPADVVATGIALGAASVTWSPVIGATSYLVRAYDAVGWEVASGWTNSASYEFPQGTFTTTDSYDVYVLATDADVLGGAVPTQVGAVETWTASTFTAP